MTTTLVGKFFHGLIPSNGNTVGVFGHVQGDLGGGYLLIKYYSWRTRELGPGTAVAHLNLAAAGEWVFFDSESELFRDIDEMDADGAKDAAGPNIVPLHGKPH